MLGRLANQSAAGCAPADVPQRHHLGVPYLGGNHQPQAARFGNSAWQCHRARNANVSLSTLQHGATSSRAAPPRRVLESCAPDSLGIQCRGARVARGSPLPSVWEYSTCNARHQERPCLSLRCFCCQSVAKHRLRHSGNEAATARPGRNLSKLMGAPGCRWHRAPGQATACRVRPFLPSNASPGREQTRPDFLRHLCFASLTAPTDARRSDLGRGLAEFGLVGEWTAPLMTGVSLGEAVASGLAASQKRDNGL